MTKMKSKKMTKSTFAIIIMAIAMVAMLAFGGTYAYFTDAADFTFTETSTGTIALGDGTVFSSTTPLKNIVPTESVFGEEGVTLTIKDDSNRAAYIFISFNIVADDAPEAEKGKFVVSGLEGKSATVGESTAAIQKTTVDGATVYYILTEELDEDENRELAPRTYTISGLNATLDKTATNVWQNITISVTASVDIIQATGFATAADAYKELA